FKRRICIGAGLPAHLFLVPCRRPANLGGGRERMQGEGGCVTQGFSPDTSLLFKEGWGDYHNVKHLWKTLEIYKK
ncbi:hypothetical protein COY52_12960, partial [Candidatus Desantisbacteria bacterium CG_4_10_14_0_8_um_filter_48_22]